MTKYFVRAHIYTNTHTMNKFFSQNSRDYTKHKRLHKRGNVFKVKLRFEIEIRAAVSKRATWSLRLVPSKYKFSLL